MPENTNSQTPTLTCCGEPMTYTGSCSEGCCDYYRCKICGNKETIEYDG